MGRSGYGDPGELALSDLQHDARAAGELESLVAHFLAIQLDAPLLYHPHRFRSAARQSCLLENLGNGERRALRGDFHLGYIGRHLVAPETRLEVGNRGLRGARAMETRDNLAGKFNLDIARI